MQYTFKALVEGVFPPTTEQLLQLEYQQTDKPDVYLSVIHCSTQKHHTYVYIGLATGDVTSMPRHEMSPAVQKMLDLTRWQGGTMPEAEVLDGITSVIGRF